MRFRSLRARFIVSSICWTGGLLFVAHLTSMVIIRGAISLHGHWILAILAVIFMIAGLAGVQRGFSPFKQLRERLSRVRDGSDRRLDGEYPNEVQPLVSDLNALLDDRERAVQRAQSTAGDLAHGLKTPLAVLAQEAERTNNPVMTQQVERMRRQIDYQLARARAAASGANPAVRTSVLASVEGLARTLQHLYVDRGIAIETHVAAEHAFRGQREDLDEMLGNLLDNACKWARSCVMIESAQSGAVLVITVDDDGPGLDPSMRDAVMQRGVRADEAAPGSGLGLAIVSDLAGLYGGSIALSSAPSGGLRAKLQLPSF